MNNSKLERQQILSCNKKNGEYLLPLHSLPVTRYSLRPSLRDGFALPIVLWTIALLTVLVMMALGAVNRWIDEASVAEKTFRARQLALSGLAIAMNQNVAPNDPILTKGDPKSNQGESYTVEITNDAGLINPNIFLKSPDYTFFFKLSLIPGI